MRLSTTPLAIALLACSAEKETDTASDTEVDTEHAITPTLGDWKFSELEYTDDGCNFDQTEIYSIAAFETNVYTLTEVSDTQAYYVDSNGLDFNCVRDGSVITCPGTFSYAIETYNDENGNPVVDEEGNPVAPDATNTITTEFVTTMSSAELGTLNASLSASCEGEDCQSVYENAGVAENPCYSTLSGITSLQ